MQRPSSCAGPLSFDETTVNTMDFGDTCRYGHRRILTPRSGRRAPAPRRSYRSSLSPGLQVPPDAQDNASIRVPVSALPSQMRGRRQLHRGHTERFLSLAPPRILARFGEFGMGSSNNLRPLASHQASQSVSPDSSIRIKRKAELQLIVEHARARKERKASPQTTRRESSPDVPLRSLLPSKASSTKLARADSKRSSISSAQSFTSARSSMSSVQSFASTENLRNGLRFGSGASRANFGPGFFNVGNTCFLDASLQILIHMKSVTHYLERHARKECLRKRLVKPGTSAENECLVCSLKDLYAARCEQGHSARMLLTKSQDEGIYTEESLVTPTDFVNAADDRYLGRRFKPHKLVDWKRRPQQDAHEYLMSWDGLLVTLQSHLKNNERTDFTKKLFAGAWQTTTTCPNDGCTNVAANTEESDVFQIQLPVDKTATQLDGLLERYFQEEILDADNAWQCKHCNCAVRATRCMRISRAPNVLIIHLSRFAVTFAGVDFAAKKVRNSVRLSRTLSLSKYLAGNQPMQADYSLSGVLCHHGKNIESGHYTSYVRGGENNTSWAHFDDLNEKCPVRICDAKEVLKGRDSYVLFYELINRKK